MAARMADPNIPMLNDDIRYEDRGGCFVLVDPTLHGRSDVASAWEERPNRWRWRMNHAHAPGEPYPTASTRDQALRDMLAAHAEDPAVARSLDAQRPRFSFGEPQIVRA